MNDQVAEMSLAYSVGDAEVAVPVGYRKTEVGVIPVDWKVLSVGVAFEICNFLRFPLSSKIREGMAGEYPYYGPTKIQDYINEYRVDGEFALIGEDGDHFLKFDSMSQTQYAKGKFNVNNHAHLVKGRVAEAIWFFYFYRNKDISIHLTRQGAGRYKLNKASLEQILCAIPHKKEQTAIANALSDVDALISEQEKLIAKKQAIKTATMQQLLTGRTRLPQFALRQDGSPKGYKQSELGEVPEDWDVVPFAKTLSIRHGKNQKEVETQDGDYPIFGTGGKMGNASCFLYDKPSVLLGRKGSINKPRYADSPFWTVDTLFYSEIAEDADAKFIFYKFCMIDWMQYNEASGVPSLNASTIEGVITSVPDKDEQFEIATILTDMDVGIQKQQQRLTKTCQIKQGMMQELLTGKTRLVKPEEVA